MDQKSRRRSAIVFIVFILLIIGFYIGKIYFSSRNILNNQSQTQQITVPRSQFSNLKMEAATEILKSSGQSSTTTTPRNKENYQEASNILTPSSKVNASNVDFKKREQSTQEYSNAAATLQQSTQ